MFAASNPCLIKHCSEGEWGSFPSESRSTVSVRRLLAVILTLESRMASEVQL